MGCCVKRQVTKVVLGGNGRAVEHQDQALHEYALNGAIGVSSNSVYLLIPQLTYV